MQMLRKLEHKCFRYCLSPCRALDSDHTLYICNKKIYDAADIPRIDNVTIKLTRDYLSKLRDIDDPLINVLAAKDAYTEPRQAFAYPTPQNFISIDAQ